MSLLETVCSVQDFVEINGIPDYSKEYHKPLNVATSSYRFAKENANFPPDLSQITPEQGQRRKMPAVLPAF